MIQLPTVSQVTYAIDAYVTFRDATSLLAPAQRDAAHAAAQSAIDRLTALVAALDELTDADVTFLTVVSDAAPA